MSVSNSCTQGGHNGNRASIYFIFILLFILSKLNGHDKTLETVAVCARKGFEASNSIFSYHLFPEFAECFQWIYREDLGVQLPKTHFAWEKCMTILLWDLLHCFDKCELPLTESGTALSRKRQDTARNSWEAVREMNTWVFSKVHPSQSK